MQLQPVIFARTRDTNTVHTRVMSRSKLHQVTPKLSITVPDAAQSTGFSENYLRVLIARHELPHVRVGRAVRLMVSDLERFLQQHRRPSYDPHAIAH